MRKLAVLLMLACVQPATGAVLIAGARMFGPHESRQRHSVSVVVEEGHLHLVVSHDARAEHDHASVLPAECTRASFSEADHVFHLAGADNALSRRAPLQSMPPPALLAVSLHALGPHGVLLRPPGPRARGADHPRTVVLRL